MKYIALFFIISFSVLKLASQGCSDAGFCTMDGIKTKGIDSVKVLKNTARLGVSFGTTRYNVGILTPYAELGRNFGEKVNISLRLLASGRFGDYTSTFDLSDVVVSGNFKLSEKMGLIAGAKIPFNNADKSYQNVPLPMSYQSSLGTFDAVLGTSFTTSRWLFVFAWQNPLNQNNNNYFEGSSTDPSLEKYLSTNKFNRAGDVLLRVSYIQKPLGKNKKLQFVYSVLPVYHLYNDTYEDSNGERQELFNSQGLTLNLNIFANYLLSKTSYLEFTVGAPIVAREVRPEGLPQFALGVEFIKRF